MFPQLFLCIFVLQLIIFVGAYSHNCICVSSCCIQRQVENHLNGSKVKHSVGSRMNDVGGVGMRTLGMTGKLGE